MCGLYMGRYDHPSTNRNTATKKQQPKCFLWRVGISWWTNSADQGLIFRYRSMRRLTFNVIYEIPSTTKSQLAQKAAKLSVSMCGRGGMLSLSTQEGRGHVIKVKRMFLSVMHRWPQRWLCSAPQSDQGVKSGAAGALEVGCCDHWQRFGVTSLSWFHLC